MKRIISFLILVLSTALLLTACGGGGGGNGGGITSGTAALSTLCGPAYDFTEGKSCDGGLCKSGLVNGDADDNSGPYSMDFSSNDRMCTKTCNTDSDCQGISFESANNVTVAAEHWICMTTDSEKYCAVSVSAPAGGGDSCSGCGGAFCSGDCIGCPQC